MEILLHSLVTVLSFFHIYGVRKKCPADFDDKWNFIQPNRIGGGPILDGSGFSYSPAVSGNHLLLDHVVLQFVADNEFFTNRAVVEVWKQIRNFQEKDMKKPVLSISAFYTGFQRPDKRNWLGFHDGVSNLKANERSLVISIDPKYLAPNDRWMAQGTYLAFLRIIIDLEKWETLSTSDQELLIGRHKLSGCPLVRVDTNGRPIKDSRCPVPGYSEVTDPGNEPFRDPPPYGTTAGNNILQQSHVGLTRPIDRVPVWDKKSFRIFRQGFEFLVASQDFPGFKAGLNFVRSKILLKDCIGL